MKKALSAILAINIVASACISLSSLAADALIHSTFESSLEGWSGRGGAKVELSTVSAAGGVSSALVSGRTDTWNGIEYTLDSTQFPAGTTVQIRSQVMQNASVKPVHFKLTMQYSQGNSMFGGNETYDTFAEGDCAAGMWMSLSADSYTIKEGNAVLYIETDGTGSEATCDFFVDEIIVTTGSADISDPPQSSLTGDADGSGTVDKKDAAALMHYLLTKTDSVSFPAADMDKNGSLDARDLSLLKQYIANPPVVTTTVTTTAVPVYTTVTTANPGQTPMDQGELMETVRRNMTQNVPNDVKNGDKGTTTHFTYYSKKAAHNKGANVWLPPGYNENETYPVLYMGHGIFGNEESMLNGFSIREMASNLILKGEAKPFIIIFTQMYTDPASEQPGGFSMTQETMDRYDDYLYDLTESLMPYVEEHWSVKTGRENTAVAGFSMGGREALYLGIMASDKIGYIAASSPAPGIVPAVDMFMQHRGSMSESEFRIDNPKPYLLMIGGGTNDGTVGTFPKQYHELFEKNGTDHIWMEVQGGGHDGSVGTPLFYNYFKGIFQVQ
ncbi:MAG: carbohydrate binding domain-containing protein [Oscillospiraceae bacterium]|nr:carbohydrate binding domain-containing protein [Oscillospiraceae bacterium]